MSATLSVDIGALFVSVLEEIAGGDGSGNLQTTHAISQFAGLLTKKTFTGGSTPASTKVWSDTVDLSAGAATIDLTNLARQTPLAAEDFDGLTVIFAAFIGAAANANPIEVAPGLTNGYNIFGTADDQVTVYPNSFWIGGSMTQDDLPTVANGSADTIDLTGTGTQQVHVLLVAG